MGRISTKIAQHGSIEPIVSRSNGTVALYSIFAQPYEPLPSFHDEHCLILPLGQETAELVRTQSEDLTLGANDLLWMRAGTNVRMHTRDHAHLIVLRIDPKALRRFVEIDMRRLFEDEHIDTERVITDPELRELATQMQVNARQVEAGAEIMFDALAQVFLVTMMRGFGHDKPTGVEFGSDFGAGDYARLIDYVEERLEQKISPKNLADLLGMSEAAFSRKFKVHTGTTPMRFVKKIRLETARGMLADPTVSFSEIALRCGFSDQAHFSRSFKKANSLTPRRYRDQLERET